MTSAVQATIAGSGRGSSDSDLQAAIAQIRTELNELQQNNQGSYGLCQFHFSGVVANGNTVGLTRKGVVQLFEFNLAGNPATMATGGIMVHPATSSAADAAVALALAINQNAPPGKAWVGAGINADGTTVNVVAGDLDEDNFFTSSSGANISSIVNQHGSRSGLGDAIHATYARFPLPAEVTANRLYIYTPFTPRVAKVQVYVTATDAPVAWDGVVTFLAPTGNMPAALIIDDSGATDWTTAHMVTVEVFG